MVRSGSTEGVRDQEKRLRAFRQMGRPPKRRWWLEEMGAPEPSGGLVVESAQRIEADHALRPCIESGSATGSWMPTTRTLNVTWTTCRRAARTTGLAVAASHTKGAVFWVPMTKSSATDCVAARNQTKGGPCRKFGRCEKEDRVGDRVRFLLVDDAAKPSSEEQGGVPRGTLVCDIKKL